MKGKDSKKAKTKRPKGRPKKLSKEDRTKNLKTIQEEKAKLGKDNKEKAIAAFNGNFLEQFNGNAKNPVPSDNPGRFKFKIEELVKARKRLEELEDGANTKEVKEIKELSKKFLSKDENKLASALAHYYEQPVWIGQLITLKICIENVINSFLDGKLTFNEVKVQDVTSEVKKALDSIPSPSKLDEEDMDKEARAAVDEMDKALSDPTFIADLIQAEADESEDEELKKAEEEIGMDVEDDKDKKEVKESDKKSEKKALPKKSKKDPNEILMEKDEVKDESFDKILQDISNGKIKIDIFDNAQTIKKLSVSKMAEKESLRKANNSVQKLDNKEYLSSFNIEGPIFNNIVQGIKKLDLSSTCNTFIREFGSKMDNNAPFIIMIKLLVDKVQVLEESVKNLNEALKQKSQVDDNIQARALKGKENTQIKKIIKSSFIPQDDWNKLSSVQKSLHQIKDWEQFPKYTIWNGYNMDDKKLFFKERIKWNIRRLEFLCDIASGKNKEAIKNPENWNMEVNAATCLINQLYYSDKYSRGTFCKEWKDLYLSVDPNVRKEYFKKRLVAKEIISKLTQEKKIKAFVYRKNVRIPVNDEVYWELDLNKIADEALSREKKNNRGKNRGYTDALLKGEKNFM